jgi:hypothetical protein
MSRPGTYPLTAVLLLTTLCLVASIARGADPGNDLHYVLTRVDDPDPAVRQSAFQVCRMASFDGAKLIQQALAAPDAKFSADSRKQLQDIVQQQLAVRQRMQTAWEAHNIWLLHSTTLAYDQFGSHNPAWDDPARDAIDLYYKGPSTLDEADRLHQDMDNGARANCDDPLFIFARAAWAAQIQGRKASVVTDWFLNAAELLEKSNYPASRRILGYAGFFNALTTEYLTTSATLPTRRNRVAHCLRIMLSLLPDAAHEEGIAKSDLIDAAYAYLGAAVAVGEDRQQAFNRVYAGLQTVYPDSAELLTLKGQFLIDYAWDARGTGWGNTVTDENAKLFSDRIEQAGRALEASWKQDPEALGARAASLMITVRMAQSAPIDGPDLWFQRAFESNPDNVPACLNEINAVDPRWSGDNGSGLVRLGRMFELSGNMPAHIPLLAVNVQWTLARSPVYSDGLNINHDYFKRPEVWQTLHRLLDPYLKAQPADRYWRNQYIAFAAASGKWDLVKDQLQYLVGYPDPNVYPGDQPDLDQVWKMCSDRYSH